METRNPFLTILGAPKRIDVRPNIEPICIYCKAKLPSKNKEHLFNACWGGMHMSSKLICDKCNAAFSRIDGCFQPFTDWIMNAHGFSGSRSKRIPEIDMESHVVSPFGQVVLSGPKIDISTDAKGTQKIKVVAKTKSELRHVLLDGKLEDLIDRKLTPTDREHLLKAVSEAKTKQCPQDPIKTQVIIDLQSQYRAAAHTILKVLKMYESNLWCDTSTEQLRRFAILGSADFKSFAVNVEPPMSVESLAKKYFNYRINSVEIYWSHCERKVFGILTLLGRIKRALVISETWQGPNAIMVVGESVHTGASIYLHK